MKCYLYFFIIICLSVSCKEKDIKETKDQGYIEYDIVYLENKLKNVSYNFLPKKMVLKFNEDYSINTIDGFMGFISIKNISDFDKSKSVTLLKFLDNKYSYWGKQNEPACCFEMTDNIEVKKTDEKKIIAGVECQKALIYLPYKDEYYPVYYTRAINIKEPNKLTPYSEIEGVLMDFILKLPNLEMNLIASKIEFIKVADEEFEVPGEYKHISRQKMNEIFQRILE